MDIGEEKVLMDFVTPCMSCEGIGGWDETVACLEGLCAISATGAATFCVSSPSTCHSEQCISFAYIQWRSQRGAMQ